MEVRRPARPWPLWPAFAVMLAGFFAVLPYRPLSQFDEGQYAQARTWPLIAGFDPQQAYFSPPLYPFVVGAVQAACGPVDWAGGLVSRIAMLASIAAAAAMLTRLTPGPASQHWWLLVVFGVLWDPINWAFGLACLTDPLYSALLLAALLAADRAFDRPAAARILVAGLVAGLSWWAKYSGPMTLLALLAFCRSRRHLATWVGIAFVAGSTIAPWYVLVHFHLPGGIGALLRHQSGYVLGVGAIPANIFEAARQMADLTGAKAWTAPLLFLGPFCGVLLLGWYGQNDKVKAWWRVTAVLLLLPALYTPYLRLWLPSRMPLTILAIAMSIQKCKRGETVTRRSERARQLAGLVSLIALAGALPSNWADEPRNRSAGYQGVVAAIQKRVAAVGTGPHLLALEPPALYYWARSPSTVPAQRIADASKFAPEQLPAGVALVVDWRSPRDLPLSKDAAITMEEFPVELSKIALLDEFGTTKPKVRPTLRLYWRKP